MRFRMSIALCAVVLLLVSVTSLAAVPATISVQGKLTDASGIPLAAGDKDFTFGIYDSQVGGTKLWLESQTIGTDDLGLWSGSLGVFEPLDDVVFQDTVRWLEITVITDVETILPRVRLLTGPYASRVATVDGASGGTITSKVSIGPGHTNSGADAFVAGRENIASGDYSSVSGGGVNSATGQAATVGGGVANSATGETSVIAGGASNTATQHLAAIGGGFLNQATAEASTVGGGNSNTASGRFSIIGGGVQNIADDTASVVSGGRNNRARGAYSVVGGGGSFDPADSNAALGDQSTVSGGLNNTAGNTYATVGGGGRGTAGGASSTVGGGYLNTANGNVSTVCGGANNNASGQYATISGGNDQSASGSHTTVGGGWDNGSNGDYATLAGGASNRAHGNAATLSGGNANVASGSHSTVPGGLLNMASGTSSFAAGSQANALHDGSFVWSDGTPTSSTGANQFLISASGGVGIGTSAPNPSSEPSWAPVVTVGPSGTDKAAILELQSNTGANNGVGALVFRNTGIGESEKRIAQIQSNSDGANDAGSIIFMTKPTLGGLTERMRIASSGFMGLGVNPSHPLHLSNGAYCSAVGVWTNASSRDYKTDIQPLVNEEYAEMLKKLEQVKVVRFRYKSDTTREHIGLIAEDVPDELASEDRTGVPTADAIAFLLATVKAQQIEIKRLEMKLTAMERDE